jgi:lipoate-protein ligase B
MNVSSGHRSWLAFELPLIPYPEALELQHRILGQRIDGTLDSDVVLILEHPPVFTLGRRGGLENMRVSQGFLEEQGVAVVQTERGGNITYHGPGQLVIYPIIDLRRHRLSITDYVSGLEEIMIRLSAQWGVAARRRPENRGVWVEERKLGSVGIAVRKNVAFHGLAFNAALDLTPFSWIQPCGLYGIQMTSLARETGTLVSMDRIRKNAAQCLEAVFGINLYAAKHGSNVFKTRKLRVI